MEFVFQLFRSNVELAAIPEVLQQPSQSRKNSTTLSIRQTITPLPLKPQVIGSPSPRLKTVRPRGHFRSPKRAEPGGLHRAGSTTGTTRSPSVPKHSICRPLLISSQAKPASCSVEKKIISERREGGLIYTCGRTSSIHACIMMRVHHHSAPSAALHEPLDNQAADEF